LRLRTHEGTTKRSESGLLRQFTKIQYFVVFETFPIWILALDLDMIHSLVFQDYENLFSLKKRVKNIAGETLFVAVLDWFNKHDLLMFKKSILKIDDKLSLISGSIAHLLTILRRDRPKMFLFITEAHTRVRHLPKIAISIARATHVQFGGPTKWESLWTSSESGWKPEVSTLRRNIGDFINYGLRPDTTRAPSSFYLSSMLLHPQRFDVDVRYTTSFSHTGFGFRKLSSPEMHHVFGLPSHFETDLRQSEFVFTPVQILDGLLFSFLRHIFVSMPRVRKSVESLPLPSVVKDGTPVFLPSLNKHLPQDWCLIDLTADKAAKADDAEIPLHLWNKRISCFWPESHQKLDVIRNFFLKWHFRRLFKGFLRHLRGKFGLILDEFLTMRKLEYLRRFQEQLGGLGSFLQPSTTFTYVPHTGLQDEIKCGMQVLNSYMGSTFFEWKNGSTLIFWNWHKDMQDVARIGFEPFISGPLPSHTKRASTFKSPMHEKILSKVIKALKRQYLVPIAEKRLKSCIDYFAVDKAGSDIRVVFNGTSCGLNEAVWAPNFWLPTADTMSRSIGYNYKFVDIDLGEMFLNFPLHPSLQLYSGVDLSPFGKQLQKELPDLKWPDKKKFYAKWTRDWMGFAPSPEWACRFYYIAEEFVRGDEKEPQNPLRWDKVILNLFGNKDYNPALPSVIKWNSLAKMMAGDLKAYVDDLRAIGWSLEHAWQIARYVASRLQFLGIQDAARKRRIDNGPWAGSIFISEEDKVQRTVSKEKWEKGRRYISEISGILKNDTSAELDFKFLERVRGYLCHLAMTYNIIFPYLKGFHLTLCSHLPNRDEEGWKVKELEWIGHLHNRLSEGKISQEEYEETISLTYDTSKAPKKIKPVKRFKSCLKALDSFFEIESPPIIMERTANVQMAVYGFVDASKSGFGASIDYENGVRYRIGTWGKDTENESSNYREFANLVETLEVEAGEGRLDNVTLIIATDNSTAEAAVYKGNSTNEKLFDLIVRFRTLELKVGGKFVVTHVSGKRMVKQGTDGISRGHLREGISIGEQMLDFCPWNLSSLERSKELKHWLEEVFGKKLEFLEPHQWFNRGHDHAGGSRDYNGFWRLKLRKGMFVWSPPPAAADAALEELRKARLKRRISTHIIVIPKLLTPLWLKQMNKACDFVITIKNTHAFWPESMCESLILGICFPYISCRPWQIRRTPKLLSMGRAMSGVSSKDQMDPGDLLRKLLAFTKRLPSLPASVVWSLLFFKKRDEVSHPLSGSN